MIERSAITLKRFLILAGLLPALVVIISSHAGVDEPDWRIEKSEAAVARALAELARAQQKFYDEDLDRNGVQDYASSLAELETAGLIDERLAIGAPHGYVLNVFTNPGITFIDAVPLSPDSGRRCFWIRQDQTVGSGRNLPPRAGWGRVPILGRRKRAWMSWPVPQLKLTKDELTRLGYGCVQ